MQGLFMFLKKLLFACIGTAINLVMQWASTKLIAPVPTPPMLPRTY